MSRLLADTKRSQSILISGTGLHLSPTTEKSLPSVHLKLLWYTRVLWKGRWLFVFIFSWCYQCSNLKLFWLQKRDRWQAIRSHRFPFLGPCNLPSSISHIQHLHCIPLNSQPWTALLLGFQTCVISTAYLVAHNCLKWGDRNVRHVSLRGGFLL